MAYLALGCLPPVVDCFVSWSVALLSVAAALRAPERQVLRPGAGLVVCFEEGSAPAVLLSVLDCYFPPPGGTADVVELAAQPGTAPELVRADSGSSTASDCSASSGSWSSGGD